MELRIILERCDELEVKNSHHLTKSVKKKLPIELLSPTDIKSETHQNKIKHQCSNCGILVSRLKVHYDRCINKGNKYFRCSVGGCKSAFITNQELKSHVKNVHNSIPVECPFQNCGKLLKPHYLKDHIYIAHQKIKVKCKNCGGEILRKYMSRHSKTCLAGGQKNFRCEIDDCQESFITMGGLSRHKKFKHENFRYTCEICGKKVIKLYQHLEYCLSSDQKRFRCNFENCTSAFNSKVSLTNHVYAVHSKSVECPYKDCNIYMRRQVVSRHIKYVHEKFKSRCGNCGKRLADLRTHLIRCTSDKVKRYRCSIENCNVSFVMERDLKQHERANHAAPIKCPHKNCNVMVKRPGLISHLKFRHDNNLKTCKYCGKTMKTLDRHYKLFCAKREMVSNND